MSNKNKMHFSLDLRIIIGVLVLVIVAMFLIWKPWQTVSSKDQVAEVNGEASLSAVPDEYVFYPMYQFKDANKETALAALTKKSEGVVAKLKELGVPESKIKTNSNGYDNYPMYRGEDSQDVTYTLQMTVTVGTGKLAQTVQDYLLSTSPVGAVSPTASFSTAKRKELEAKARDQATKDARAKADQMAKNLGFKVGKVKSVRTANGFGDIMPMAAPREALDSEKASASLSLQPGENDLNYSVTVTYYIR